jgi:hypothetical protein
MLLPLPPCPLLSAARIAGLQATVLLLLTLLIKAKIQIKAASTVGWILLALQTLVFLGVVGALGLAVVGGGGALMARKATGSQGLAG